MTTITAMQAMEALDELESSARGDEPFNNLAAPVVRAFIESAMAAPATAPKSSTYIRERAQLEQEWAAINWLQQQHKNLPAWQDAPTVPGLWLAKSSGIVRLVDEHDIEHLQKYGLPRWFGPIQEDKP